jgi:hypothetical protein
MSQLDKSFFDEVSHHFYFISLFIMGKVTHLIFTMKVHREKPDGCTLGVDDQVSGQPDTCEPGG